MIDSKKINIISYIAVILAVAAVIAMIIFGREYTYTPEYAKTVFGADIITIDIHADETEWQNMLDNAINEEYIMADVAVNGKKYSYVGIRPKGNNSLQQVYSSDSDRYSFKIKFDEYAAGQTCGGLDMLVLNDMLGDATYMKEYTAFEMMKELGIETPYFGYAKITVNGEDWGLYFALEAYNDSYLHRVSGNENGTLYNVKSTDMGVGNFGNAEKSSDDSSENTQFHGFGGKGGGGMGASNSGGSLVYTDNEISSYPAIFGNIVGSGDEEAYTKVITSLKALNSGENIEEYFDVDEILRYLAVHSFVVNLDSYSSNMAQNYYIYEQDGVIKILPWDYNYAWGAFQGGTASATVNFPIDTPVSGVEMSERPLISVLFENEEYLERYHSYLNELLEKYFTNGKFNNKIDELDNLIGGYVQSDPTAFYTYDEYQTAIEAFKNLANLRVESVSGQLNGTVPSTTAEQKTASDKLVDASSVTMSQIGTSGMGSDHGFGDFGGNRSDFKMGCGRDFGGFGNFGGGEPPKFDENNVPPDLPNGDSADDNTNSNDMQVQPNLPNDNNLEDNTSSNNMQTPPDLPDGNNSENNTESNIKNTMPDFSRGENNSPKGDWNSSREEAHA
ncbi:MAG: CotH kinase family protein, partial [Oscillospiraceae bacterium]|nr:CotH kinase family protein [Oscillospiraceae bacterium]